MNNRLRIGLLLASLLAGCGPAVNPEEVMGPSCSDVCWDLSQTSVLEVNDFPFLTSLSSKEVSGWRFPTVSGHRYSVKVKVASGSCHTYVSSKVVIDLKNNTLTDYNSNSGITFSAETKEAYILVQEAGNLQGSVFSVRIVSYDENRDPLPGTVFLFLNDPARAFRVIPKEVVRVMFNGNRGQDYTVKVRVTSGSTDTFLSRIPSVDAEVYDLADVSSNDDIRFRAAETTIYYVAVVDRGNVAGSDFTVQVTSP